MQNSTDAAFYSNEFSVELWGSNSSVEFLCGRKEFFVVFNEIPKIKHYKSICVRKIAFKLFFTTVYAAELIT